MSIEDASIVDFISVDEKNGAVQLTISDHLIWLDGDRRHLELLENKLNKYLSFIESGELYASYEKAVGKAVVIEMVCRYPLTDEATEFVEYAKTMVRKAGFELQCRVYDPSIP